jgi:hypothetical protein
LPDNQFAYLGKNAQNVLFGVDSSLEFVNNVIELIPDNENAQTLKEKIISVLN